MASSNDIANNDLLERIPLDTSIVLDVGCGTGSLASAYRRLNPRARLLGVDKDPAAAAIAAQRFDEVAVVDVERNPLPFVLDRPIDCLIYADVLEYLDDPWRVLRRHQEALSDEGSMLIRVPNVEHWSIAERLLRGTWQYEPGGLLDQAHLRWFGLESMRQDLLKLLRRQPFVPAPVKELHRALRLPERVDEADAVEAHGRGEGGALQCHVVSQRAAVAEADDPG